MPAQNKIFALSGCALGAAMLFALPQGGNAYEVSVRDVRTETRTTWDYQPLQGPRRRAEDKDFFRPETHLPDQPLAPPPPVVSGDYRDPPRAEEMMPPPRPDNWEPRTETAVEVGLQGSNYHYHEKDLLVKLQGPQGGVVVQATGGIGGQWFLRGDGRVAVSEPDYKGSGEMDGTKNIIGEVRATIGRDFLWRRVGLAPYVGLGWRALYNDLRGTSTTGARGYRRYSNYFFAPVGVMPTIRFFNGDRLTLTGEFDQLIGGWQQSRLSDVYAGYPDMTNKQVWGFGLHGSLMYKTGNWSFGPYGEYWNINQSKEECNWGSGAPIIYYICGVEPHNHTLEYGFQFRYRFLEYK